MSFNSSKIPEKGAKTKIWPKVLAKFSDIWKFTQYIIYTIKFHKVLKNGAKKLYSHMKEEIMLNLNILSEKSFDHFKIPKKGAKMKIWPIFIG